MLLLLCQRSSADECGGRLECGEGQSTHDQSVKSLSKKLAALSPEAGHVFNDH